MSILLKQTPFQMAGTCKRITYQRPLRPHLASSAVDFRLLQSMTSNVRESANASTHIHCEQTKLCSDIDKRIQLTALAARNGAATWNVGLPDAQQEVCVRIPSLQRRAARLPVSTLPKLLGHNAHCGRMKESMHGAFAQIQNAQILECMLTVGTRP